METLYRKVAVSDIDKLMKESLTTKKRSGEYRTALNHVLNISQDLDDATAQLQADKAELLEALKIGFNPIFVMEDMLGNVIASGNPTENDLQLQSECEMFIEKYKSLIQKHKS